MRQWMCSIGIVAALVVLSGCAAPTSKMASLQSGYQDYQQGQYVDSENIAQTYIASDTTGRNLAEAYYLAAISEEYQDELASAAEDYRSAIVHTQRRDLRRKSFTALGDIAYIQAHFDQAVVDYKNALDIYSTSPTDSHTLYRLGTALENTGHWNDAREYLDQLVTSYPNSQLAKNARLRLAMNYFSLQFGAWKNARSAWAQVARVKAIGIVATVTPRTISGHTLFLVRGGIYRNDSEAMAARSALSGQIPQVIVVP